MRSYKKYKSTSGIEYNFYVRVDGKDHFVSLNGPGTMLIVDDPKVANAIERSRQFTSGKIALVSVVGNMEAPSPTPVKEVKPVVADHSYPEVKNMGDAVEVLISKYGVKESDIARKAQVLAKADELGVIFPNYK